MHAFLISIFNSLTQNPAQLKKENVEFETLVARFHKINRNLEEGNEILTNWIGDNKQILNQNTAKYEERRFGWREEVISLKDQNVELMQKLEVKAMDEKELQKKFGKSNRLFANLLCRI